MPPFPSSLERPIGSPGVGIPNAVLGISWADDWEQIPELRWPAAGRTFDAMRRDAQCAATLRAIVVPARARAHWRFGDDGVDARVVQACVAEFGLWPDWRARARRRREGISFARYLREALSHKLAFGHAGYELVYRLGPPGPGQEARGMPRVMAHLGRLELRPARAIDDIVVARNGDLEGVKQLVGRGEGPLAGLVETVTIPLRDPGGYRRLLLHVNEQEGAQYRGESLFRASWKHWWLRDQLLKVGAMAVDRNGLGVPVVTYDESLNANRHTALEIARRFRAGDEAGIALPPGYTIRLLGVEGQTRDELPLVKYHDQQIGKNALTMMLDLGHDRGARSLGETFLELATSAENAVLQDFAEEVTEFLVREFVALNFGPDEPYPPLVVDELTPDQVLSTRDLVDLVNAGVVIPDDELEAEIRRRSNLPERRPPEFELDPTPPVPQPPDVPPPGPPIPEPAPGPAPAPDRPSRELAARLAALQYRVEGRRRARARIGAAA